MGELTLYHLQISQSERIVWLLEELGIPYTLKNYPRDPETMLCPDIFRELHSAGTAPILVDSNVSPALTLAESGAIAEYIVQVYGKGALTKKPGEAGYVEYLEWLHYSQGSLFPFISRIMAINRLGEDAKKTSFAGFAHHRVNNALSLMDKQLAKTKYLGADDLLLTDIMTVFDLTTMRAFVQDLNIAPHKNIQRYLQDIGKIESYQRAMKKGDPDLEPVLGVELTQNQRETVQRITGKIFKGE